MLAVAVLPFVDMSEEKNQTYFADGLSEEILNLLAQSATMRVIARTSSFSFKDRPELDIATIARRLDATHVLEGSVRKSGDHVRITAQLVDGATSAHLWSRTYDRDLTDIFSVQDDIAAAVAAQLDATLGDGGDLQRADTTNPRAFERYLHGRYFFNRSGESDVTRAREYFEQALQDDPNYARAWAGLAGTYNASFSSGQAATPEAQRAWLASIERALSLGPGLAEVHVRAAQYYWWLGEWRRSEEHCKLAIALNPSDSLVLSVSALKAIAIGHRHEALSLQRRAVAVDPLSAQGRAHLGMLLAAVGELEEAEVELRACARAESDIADDRFRYRQGAGAAASLRRSLGVGRAAPRRGTAGAGTRTCLLRRRQHQRCQCSTGAAHRACGISRRQQVREGRGCRGSRLSRR